MGSYGAIRSFFVGPVFIAIGVESQDWIAAVDNFVKQRIPTTITDGVKAKLPGESAAGPALGGENGNPRAFASTFSVGPC